MRETLTHIFFFGSQYSQWAETPFKEGQASFNCTEQYMMYWKAAAFGDIDTLKKIMATNDPYQQKKFGRQVKDFNDERWNLIKEQVVYQGNLLKFTQNPELRHILTVDHRDKIFVEASPTDKIWGIGLGLEDDRIFDEKNWNGENLLGKAINKVQKRLITI